MVLQQDRAVRPSCSAAEGGRWLRPHNAKCSKRPRCSAPVLWTCGHRGRRAPTNNINVVKAHGAAPPSFGHAGTVALAGGSRAAEQPTSVRQRLALTGQPTHKALAPAPQRVGSGPTSTCSPCSGRAGGLTFKSAFYGLCIYLCYISSNPFSGAMRLCPKQLRGGVGCCYGGGLVDPSKSCCCCCLVTFPSGLALCVFELCIFHLGRCVDRTAITPTWLGV